MNAPVPHAPQPEDSLERHQSDSQPVFRPKPVLPGVQRVLLHISYTEFDLIVRCPKHELGARVLTGAFVMVTGTLACLSMGYAAQIGLRSGALATLLALIWGVFVVGVDRSCVSQLRVFSDLTPEGAFMLNRLMPFAWRLPVALAVAAVVTVPIELRVFEQEITAQLQASANRGRSEVRAASRGQALAQMADLVAEQGRVSERQRELEIAMMQQSSQIASEQRRPLFSSSMERDAEGNRVLVRRERENAALASQQKLFQQNEREVAQLQAHAEALRTQLTQARSKLDAPDAVRSPVTAGLLDRVAALLELVNRDRGARLVYWGLGAIVMLIELMPALMKLLSSCPVYERLVYEKYAPRDEV
jgi:hypothetical protein